MPGARIDGVALGSVAAGSVLLYAGITGKSIPLALQAVIQGKSPATAPQKYGIQQSAVQPPGTSASSSGNLGSGSGAALAEWGRAQVGKWRYVFGGAPRNGVVDCSSLVNEGYGHVFGLAIPFYKAGGYDGSSHGPPTTAWFIWTGCITISSNPADAQPGDLAIWDIHHMGICLGPDQMVSAQNPVDGVKVSAITGFSSGAFLIRRLKAIGPATPNAAPGPGGILPTPTGLPRPQIGVTP
jgi:cell wall-associated NlpC family hydrolase